MKKEVLALAMGFSLLISPLATQAAGNTGVLDNDPTVSEEVKLKLKNEAEIKDKKIMKWAKQQEAEQKKRIAQAKANKKGDVGTQGYADGDYYSIPVSFYKQIDGVYCGPASVRQTLSFHKSKSGSSTGLPSQTTLANKIGTSSQGSSSYGLMDALNSYKYTYSFSGNPYGVADIANLSNPTATFEWRIKYVLSNYINAPIILINTKYLPRYNGTEIRHYNTVNAYSYEYATGIKSIKTVDPHYNDAYNGYAWNPLGSTTKNGVVRAVYQADLQSANPVMVY